MLVIVNTNGCVIRWTNLHGSPFKRERARIVGVGGVVDGLKNLDKPALKLESEISSTNHCKKAL